MRSNKLISFEFRFDPRLWAAIGYIDRGVLIAFLGLTMKVGRF